jgi:hypothetical protein
MDSSARFTSAGSTCSLGQRVLAVTWAVTLLSAALLGPFAVSAQTAPAGPTAVQTAPGQPAPTGQAASQPTGPAAQATPQPHGLFPTQPPPTGKSGFIYSFGRWLDNTRGKIGNLGKGSNGPAALTQDALKNAAEATRKAATAIVRLPTSRFIEVHQRCAVAPNGAPDCRSAAAHVCRGKGFSGGHPIDVQSSENCPPAVWMSGREPAPGECPEETVVLMVACD